MRPLVMSPFSCDLSRSKLINITVFNNKIFAYIHYSVYAVPARFLDDEASMFVSTVYIFSNKV